MKKGVWLGIGAYAIWGLFPIYWHWLQQVPALQILAHRIVWSFVLLAVVMTIGRRWRTFRTEALKPRLLRTYFIAALLLSANWLIYVWAVNAGYVVESSLGYFINPLLSVLMGVIILHERLRRMQWAAVGLAAVGVAYLALVYGSLPWIALSLALSFGLYGLVTKQAPLNALHGLTLETAILFGPMLLYLIVADVQGQGVFLHTDSTATLLMIGAGPVTVIPLLMFASAVRSVTLSMIGILQYITPTLQFLIGLFIFKEPFTPMQLVGFGLVWLAVIIFTSESLWARRQAAQIAKRVQLLGEE
ncbi:MAG TPA: EamA family transporter RarD [Anaerolineae bacterium]|nr:EamA family transporter RarD [Anaerolineae bacterium]